MKDQLQTILLGVIALTQFYTVYSISNLKSGSDSHDSHNHAEVAQNATPASNPATINPINPADPSQAQPAQPAAPQMPATKMEFAQMEKDFGTVKQDTENKHVFKFKNTGTEPLLITNAQGSCGCTVPEYPKEPIAPGATGEIKVVYSPGKQSGMQTKNVTITANTEPSTTMLTIKANVVTP